MKKYAALLLACALMCALLPAAQADGYYGAYNAAGTASAYGLADYGMNEMSSAYGAGDFGMANAVSTFGAADYGMTELSSAYGLSGSVSAGVSAGYGMAVSSPAYSMCPPVPAFKEFDGYINGYRINVRSCPGTNGTVCGVVSYGDRIHVTNQTYVANNRLWYYGSIGCLCGWIFSGYVGGAPMTVPCPAVTSCAVPRGYGTICMNGTNFRTGPGLCYASLMQLKRGTLVQLLSAVTDCSRVVWYQVLTSGCTGWVRSDLITTAGCASYGIPAPYTCGASFTGYTNMNAVNVRMTPNGTVITQVSRGTTVYVFGIVCQYGVYWYQVRFYGGVGYIRADLVTASGYTPSCPAPAYGNSGVNYYDYSSNSTTIITDNAASAPVYGSAYPAAGSTNPSANAWSGAASAQSSVPEAVDYPYEAAASLPQPSSLPATLSFTTCAMDAGQTLAVYTAPNTESLRADSGTAQVTLSESLYAAGFDGQWLLIMYRNQNQMTRVGYVNAFQLQGTLPSMPPITFSAGKAMISCRTALTSDPMEQTDALMMLNTGDSVTFLATLQMNGQWAYVETMYNGVPVRGFVPMSSLNQEYQSTVPSQGEVG